MPLLSTKSPDRKPTALTPLMKNLLPGRKNIHEITLFLRVEEESGR
jgi:hypothetical protein